MARYRDFDAAWAETRRECPRIKLFGETYELPAEMPALVALEAARRMEAGEDAAAEVKAEAVIDLLQAILGEETLHTLLRRGLGFSQLADIVSWALMIYTGAADEDAAGEAPAPETGLGSTTSSNISASSRPTSSASTGSISGENSGADSAGDASASS